MTAGFSLFGLRFEVAVYRSYEWSLGAAADLSFKPFFLNFRLSLIAPFDFFLTIERDK